MSRAGAWPCVCISKVNMLIVLCWCSALGANFALARGRAATAAAHALVVRAAYDGQPAGCRAMRRLRRPDERSGCRAGASCRAAGVLQRRGHCGLGRGAHERGRARERVDTRRGSINLSYTVEEEVGREGERWMRTAGDSLITTGWPAAGVSVVAPKAPAPSAVGGEGGSGMRGESGESGGSPACGQVATPSRAHA